MEVVDLLTDYTMNRGFTVYRGVLISEVEIEGIIISEGLNLSRGVPMNRGVLNSVGCNRGVLQMSSFQWVAIVRFYCVCAPNSKKMCNYTPKKMLTIL